MQRSRKYDHMADSKSDNSWGVTVMVTTDAVPAPS
jgi:hypothetical protein